MARDFTLIHSVRIGPGAHTAYPLSTRSFLPEFNQSGRKITHSPPSSAQVKNTWRYTSTPRCLHFAMHRPELTSVFTEIKTWTLLATQPPQ